MRVFVGCSAKDTLKRKYDKLASDVATVLAKRGSKLVFGGVDSGMMGKCYMTFRYEGLPVMGVADLTDAEILKNIEVDAYEVTPTTFRRTEEIFKNIIPTNASAIPIEQINTYFHAASIAFFVLL